jgi:hypothetical protein
LRRRWHNPRAIEFQETDREPNWIRVCALHLRQCQDAVLVDDKGIMTCPLTGHVVRSYVVLDPASLTIFASIDHNRLWVREDS